MTAGRGRAVMVLGTSSGAGKSWLATALCRWYARQGLKVAPFKAQNMSNNARVVPGLDGRSGEIGSAQYFQALAARARPHVGMNPVLLKPEHDRASQVVLMGEVRDDLRRLPWRERSEHVWPVAQAALQALLADNDVVVIEGAGSPAEINLHGSDYVNLRTAQAARAACLLVCDIDRGGAFAHLYGTHQLMPPAERALVRGFVLNRFRGDPALLAPGPERLQALTGVPTVAVLPMVRAHGLPEEDGVFDDAPTGLAGPAAPGGPWRVAVIACPHISNLDEFQPLRSAPGVRLTWARSPKDLQGADCIILPGSKHTLADLAWLKAQGLAAAIQSHAEAGGAVLGVCGGLQMLGHRVHDPLGVEGGQGQPAQLPQEGASHPVHPLPSLSAAGAARPIEHGRADEADHAPAQASAPSGRHAEGLGLLDLETVYERDKLLSETSARFRLPSGGDGPWCRLDGIEVTGYEIHHGRTRPATASPDHAAKADTLQAVLHDGRGHCVGWRQGSVMGVYLHGLFECPAFLSACTGSAPRPLDDVFDALADLVDAHFNPGVLLGLLEPG